VSPLADLQRQVTGAILGGGHADMPTLAPSPIPAEAAFAVHRDTALGGLAGALRLTFPTVDALVGEAFFDQTARDFVAEHPPRCANLSTYGEGFPDFIEHYPHAASLAYLGDVARLDLAVGRALAKPDTDVRREIALDPAVRLSLPASLSVLDLGAPADLIRDGVETGDDQLLAAIDLSAPRWLAVWRTGRTIAVQPLSKAAGRFLGGILTGDSVEDALAAATADIESAAALQAIQAEVFAARFAQIIQTPPEET
jgi:Putative DNA-binding domain